MMVTFNQTTYNNRQQLKRSINLAAMARKTPSTSSTRAYHYFIRQYITNNPLRNLWQSWAYIPLIAAIF